MVGAGLYVRVLANESEEPLNDAGSLRARVNVSVYRTIVFPDVIQLTE